MTNIYLDENLSEYVANALNELNKGYFSAITVYSTKVKFGKGAKDETIIPEIGKDMGVLITQDINIYTTIAQYQLCKKHNLAIFFLKMSKHSKRHWDIVKALINNWEEIIHTIANEKRPFAFRVKNKGKLEKMK